MKILERVKNKMDEIPQADRDEMELDRAPNSDFEDSEESDDDREEEEEDKEVFVPGKHKLEEGEELVRDTRLAFILFSELSFFLGLIRSI